MDILRPKIPRALGRGAAARLIVILLCLIPALLLLACGKKLPPLSLNATAPGPVKDFHLSQEGDNIILSWVLPEKNLVGQPLTQIQGCRLFRGETKGVMPQKGCLPEFKLRAEIDLAYPKQGLVKGNRMVFQDRGLKPGRRYHYRVAGYDQSGTPGGWSPVLALSWGVLPPAPRELKARPGDRVVNLAWSPVTLLLDGSRAVDLAGYRVYRRGEGVSTRVTKDPVTATTYQDVAVENEVDYTYLVRAVRKVGPDLLQSEASPTAKARPQRLTPPPPLLNLGANPAPGGLELRWDPSPDKDLAGYRVYRREEGETAFKRLTSQLLPKPYFLDAKTEKGRTYHYYVTAVDDSPRHNESQPSEEAVINY